MTGDARTTVPNAPLVLLIEDDVDTREMYAFLLDEIGVSIAHAGHAQDGLRLALEQRPAVIVTDIGMPGPLDAFTMTRMLHADPRTRHVPIIAVTGYDAVSVHASGRFYRVLVKPIDTCDLIALVRATLEYAAKRDARAARWLARGPRDIRPPEVA